jgi:hypothetical protein
MPFMSIFWLAFRLFSCNIFRTVMSGREVTSKNYVVGREVACLPCRLWGAVWLDWTLWLIVWIVFTYMTYVQSLPIPTNFQKVHVHIGFHVVHIGLPRWWLPYTLYTLPPWTCFGFVLMAAASNTFSMDMYLWSQIVFGSTSKSFYYLRLF